MIRQSRKVQFIILLTLVCLVGTMTIAYAVLSTTLNINGTAQVMDASWNVHFENIEVNPYSVPISPKITDNDKITFQADLTTPGQFYKFTVDIVNDGSIDAMIESIIKNPELTTDQKKYLRYEIEYVDGTSINESQILKANETKTISVLVSYRNDIPTTDLPTTQTNLDLEIRLIYVQATSTGTEISGTDSIIKVVSSDLNTAGSEICIGEECFYLINNDGYNVTMLAKYNLYIGNQVYTVDGTTLISNIENPTGKQSVNAIGATYYSNGDQKFPWIGTIAYSSTKYWWDSKTNNVKSEYSLNSYGYPYIYDSNCTLYSYIEEYKSYLETLGIVIENARLINFEELAEFGCTKDDCSSSPSWIYNTTYWTGVAYDSRQIHRVYSSKFIGAYSYDGGTGAGIRPVIEIPLTEF